MSFLRRLYNDVVVKIFLWMGTLLYRVVCCYTGKDDEVTAIHFAASEQDLNNSMREYVENLDKP